LTFRTGQAHHRLPEPRKGGDSGDSQSRKCCDEIKVLIRRKRPLAREGGRCDRNFATRKVGH